MRCRGRVMWGRAAEARSSDLGCLFHLAIPVPSRTRHRRLAAPMAMPGEVGRTPKLIFARPFRAWRPIRLRELPGGAERRARARARPGERMGVWTAGYGG